MSEKLGPIHYMMYDKIKFQDKITAHLLDNDTSEVDKIFKPVSTDPLDELIDQDNVHGWLDSKVDIVESRLAYALKHSTKTSEKMYQLGKIIGQDKDFQSLDTIFQDLNMYLLDGMPCDKGLAAQVDDKGDLYLITNVNMHSKYEDNTIDPDASLDNQCEGGHDHESHESFELSKSDDINLDGKASSYHNYRLKFLEGYFSNSPYDVELVNGENFRIYPR